jgi:hypothetical protein
MQGSFRFLGFKLTWQPTQQYEPLTKVDEARRLAANFPQAAGAVAAEVASATFLLLATEFCRMVPRIGPPRPKTVKDFPRRASG